MWDEAGFGLVEVLVAALLLAVGLGFTLASFTAPQKQTLTAQRQSQMAAIAEREVERLANRPWSRLGLTAAPAPVATQFHPRSHLVANTTCGTPAKANITCLRVRQSFNAESPTALTGTGATGEPMVTVANGAASSSTVGGATVHRFVTWKDREPCAPSIDGGGVLDQILNSVTGFLLGGLSDALKNSLLGKRALNLFCAASDSTKRVTVAVTLPPAGNQAGPLRPVWISTVVPNPTAGVFNSDGNVGANCPVIGLPLLCGPIS